MDRAHRDLFTAVLEPTWTHGVQAAIDTTLMSRYYERYADHAVAVARRVIQLVTGTPFSQTGATGPASDREGGSPTDS
jgi:phosphate transport system protein